MKSVRRPDVLIALFLLLLPLLWFAPQVLGGKTLLPADNLFASEPWKSFAAEQGVGVPHNLLISDLILENRPWKSLIVEALRSGSLTDILWNPRNFAGVPFLAAGQHSALYPLSVIFYALPLWRAYGIFTWLQLGLAALGMYVFARVLRLRRAPATLAAVVYAFSGFYLVSVAFTMIIAAAAWLPLILAVIEIVARKQEEKGGGAYSPVPYIVLGAAFLGLQVLAGHVEITYYTLMVMGFYAAWRLIGLGLRLRQWRPPLRLAAWLALMAVLGLALGAAQLIPLYELVSQSFREGAASLQQVRDWAWPSRQIITFLLPDFFGNPTAHSYFDIWQRAWVPVTQNALGEPLNTIDWGVKNYVEGGNYLGLLTWLLAGVAVIDALRRKWRTSGGAEETSGSPTLRVSAPQNRAGLALFVVLASVVAALRLRHAALCGALLSAARLQPAPLGVSLGVSLHAEHGGAGGVWAGCVDRRSQESGARSQWSGTRNQRSGTRDRETLSGNCARIGLGGCAGGSRCAAGCAGQRLPAGAVRGAGRSAAGVVGSGPHARLRRRRDGVEL